MKIIPFHAFVALAAVATGAAAQPYTFTTLAGDASFSSIDGTGSAAHFQFPNGVAMDQSGNVYVADTRNHTIRKITASGVVTTLAGQARIGGGRVDGVGSVARFASPRGLAVDSAGNLYVADTNNHAIRKITAGGVVTTLSVAFNFPVGVAVDGSGNVYVADSGNNAVHKITSDGVIVMTVGFARFGGAGSADGIASAARFSNPTGVAVDGTGNVIVADRGNATLRKISPEGIVTTLAGAAGTKGSADGIGGAARFVAPSGIAVDGIGNVFVADSDNHTIRKITPGGAVTTLAGSAGAGRGSVDGSGSIARFNAPASVAVDRDGNVMVADAENGTIRRITAIGLVTTLAGFAEFAGSADGSGGGARFAYPNGVAVDGVGNIFVADSGNHTIRKITRDGVVTTVAGLVRISGSADGTGGAARFSFPRGVAVDGNGNLFVADTNNETIRKITPDGVVSTLAGMAGSRGIADGAGSGTRFAGPRGVAVDQSGNVFVADTLNNMIRKISVDGIVTTLATFPYGEVSGVAVDGKGNVFAADLINGAIRRIASDGSVTTFAGGGSGSADGTGTAARFYSPFGVAVDGSGNVFVADLSNSSIRKITTTGVVTTLAGAPGTPGSADGTGSEARFFSPHGVAVDRDGNVFVADYGNHTIRKGVPAAIRPFAVNAPQSQHVNLGASTTLSVMADGDGFSFQWKKDGVAIAGATSAIYSISRAAAGDMGFYSAVVTSAAGSVESPLAILTVATGSMSRLINFSARGFVPAGGDLTAGFVIGGGEKSVLVRAVGPALGSFGVPGVLADPRLDLFPASAFVSSISSNNDWGGGATLANAFARVGAFPFPATSQDAALLVTLASHSTARVSSSIAGGSGIALTEVYDLDSPGGPSRLINISTLGLVGAGSGTITMGFVIDGTAPKRLLIRAVGPGLEPRVLVGGVLGDPQLSISPLGKPFTVATNDNWGGDPALAEAFYSAGAFFLPSTSKDAAFVGRLPPGGYTVTVAGVANSAGFALVEIYDLEP